MTRACAECGDVIPAKRLELLPQTTHCAPCASDITRRARSNVPRPSIDAQPMTLRRSPAEQAAADTIRIRRRQKKQRKQLAQRERP